MCLQGHLTSMGGGCKTANFRSPAGPALKLVAFWSRLCNSPIRKLFKIGFYEAQTRRNPFARQTPKIVREIQRKMKIFAKWHMSADHFDFEKLVYKN